MSETSQKPKIESPYALHSFILNRWSPRSFSAKEVENEELMTLLEAARWAASTSNSQPWRFIAGRKGEENFDKILSTLVEGNRLWAKDAPAFIATFNKGGSLYDLGLAIGNLSTQATSMNLYVHQMAGFMKEKMMEVFELSDEYQAVTVLAVGYLGEPDALQEPFKSRELAPQTRLPLAELLLK
jgi:nitroreductase